MCNQEVIIMIAIKIELHDQEDAEEIVLMLRTLLVTFDEYIVEPKIRSHFDRVE